MRVYFKNSFIFMLLLLEIAISLELCFWIVFLGKPLLVVLVPVILYLMFVIGPMILDQLE